MGIIGPRTRFHADALERKLELGLLPIARRDVERLQQVLSMIPRVLDIHAHPFLNPGVLTPEDFAIRAGFGGGATPSCCPSRPSACASARPR